MRRDHTPVKTVDITPLPVSGKMDARQIHNAVKAYQGEIFRGTVKNNSTGLDILVGRKGINDTGTYAARRGIRGNAAGIETVRALGGINSLLENAILVKGESIKTEGGQDIKKYNPQRLYQLIFATPYNDGNQTNVAVIRVDVMESPTNPQNRFYNLRSINTNMAASSPKRRFSAVSSPAEDSAAVYNVADLYGIVNQS
jgi:hypothetical protein